MRNIHNKILLNSQYSYSLRRVHICYHIRCPVAPSEVAIILFTELLVLKSSMVNKWLPTATENVRSCTWNHREVIEFCMYPQLANTSLRKSFNLTRRQSKKKWRFSNIVGQDHKSTHGQAEGLERIWELCKTTRSTIEAKKWRSFSNWFSSGARTVQAVHVGTPRSISTTI